VDGYILTEEERKKRYEAHQLLHSQYLVSAPHSASAPSFVVQVVDLGGELPSLHGRACAPQAGEGRERTSTGRGGARQAKVRPAGCEPRVHVAGRP
jgi:hypothetical protein